LFWILCGKNDQLIVHIDLNYDDRRLSPIAQQPPRVYSMLRSSPLVVMLAVMLGCLVNFAEPDLWLDVLVGRLIINTAHIPRYDSYSYSAFGLPWHNHEWLAQVVCAVAYQWLGVIGLSLVKVASVAVTMSVIAAGLSVTQAAATIQRFVLLATAAALIGNFQVLPQLFSFAMFSILMSRLAVEVYHGPVRLGRWFPCLCYGPIFTPVAQLVLPPWHVVPAFWQLGSLRRGRD
jgi:hypothetical protein